MKEQETANVAEIAIDCRLSGIDETGQKTLTVGDLFKIECPSSSFILNPKTLKFTTKKPFQLQILKTELQPDGRLQLLVTSYQVGEFNETNLSLTDGVGKVLVKGIQFKVQSVIDPKNPPKEPFGPFGAYTLSLPMIYLWVSLSIITLLLVGGALKVIRRWQRRRLIDGLKKHDSRLSPQTQLHVRFRQLERNRFLEGGELKKYLLELDDILRVYIIRKFKIPALDWSDRLVIKDFRNRFAFFGAEMVKELVVLLRETRKVKAMLEPQSKDIEQLERKIKRWADQVERFTGNKGQNRGVLK